MSTLRRAILAIAVVAALPTPGACQTEPWHHEYRLWRPTRDEPKPWQSDPRMAGRFTEPNFPDDIQVVFLNPDSARGGKHELMWVTLIAQDPSSGHYLGFLLNQPDFLTNVQAGDNVTIAFAPNGWAVAVQDAGGSYASGWPDFTVAPGYQATLREGIRLYRTGNFGHNPPGIQACIKTLLPLADSGTPPNHSAAFLTHFVLGRCLAEEYHTVRAVTAFHRAIAIAPDSLDAQMGLLAELSVLAATAPDRLTEGSEAEWERAFLDQLAVVRKRFASDTSTLRMVDFLLGPKSASDTTNLTPAQLAKRRRVGFAVIRWKQR